jgi:hypothetical protein
MRTEVIQTAIRTLLRQVPFQPFALNIENGDRILIEHPENVAFDPGDNGPPPGSKFSVVSRQIFFIGAFEAVSSVALLDTGERIA